MNPSRSPKDGEVLKLGPPASGEVVITVDPGSTGTAFAAGTQTLLPGAEVAVHRYLDQDTVLFVHKGQARATLNERVIIVVPGAMLYVPRGAWHSLRNTGTGALQIAWVSAPPGLEAFFRDLSRAGASPTASGQTLQELAQRHRIEFRQAAEARAIHAERSAGTERVPADAPPRPRSGSGRRRGRRGGRRHRGEQRTTPAGASGPAQASSAPSPAPAVAPPVAPSAPAAPGGRRRRRRRRRTTPPAAPQRRREETGGASPVSVAAPAQQPSRPGAGRQRPPRGRHRRRVREVYMGGRWVQVEGEGPVIASGPQRPERRGPKQDGDDDPPAVRLSVPL